MIKMIYIITKKSPQHYFASSPTNANQSETDERTDGRTDRWIHGRVNGFASYLHDLGGIVIYFTQYYSYFMHATHSHMSRDM